MFKRVFDRKQERGSGGPAAPEVTPIVDLHEARQAQEAGAHLLDVREKDEWDGGHIAGAILHPLPYIASDPDVGVAADTAIVTYCKAGGRAERAAEILRADGYNDVQAMCGGFEDWKAAGYPTE
jgi:rhodanese-related sulfurtransferase